VSALEFGGIRFYPDELRDLAIAWVALGVAFAIFILDPPISPALIDAISSPEFLAIFLLSMATVGVGFLLHELAHKVVAVRFGQIAAFRADYGMLALCIGAALANFLFAAPGAVYHSGRITHRESAGIALAGPLTSAAVPAAVPTALRNVRLLWFDIALMPYGRKHISVYYRVVNRTLWSPEFIVR